MDVTYEVHARRRAFRRGTRYDVLDVVPTGSERDALALADRLRSDDNVVDVEVRRIQASARTRGARWESVDVDEAPEADRRGGLAGVASARAALRNADRHRLAG